MNSSTFMDKQIMDLSNSERNEFIDLMNYPQEDQINGGKKEDIVLNCDFQSIPPIGESQPSNFDFSNAGVARVSNSDDLNINASGVGSRNYGSLDSIEPAKVILEKDRDVCVAALVFEIDRTMKNHAYNLLHALEGVSARLSQLESRSRSSCRTRHLENSVDDLKVSVGNNHGSIDGQMRHLENILREVQADVNVVRDKQEIAEAQLQLAKLQVSEVDKQSETQNTVHVDSVQQLEATPQQSHQQFPPIAVIQPPSGLQPPNAAPPPPPTSQLNLPSPVQFQDQFPPNPIPSLLQQDSYFPPPGQTQDAPNQHFQPSPSLPPPQQQYQPPPHPQYFQIPPQHHPSPPPPQTQPPFRHHPEETQYVQSQNYPPSLRQPPFHPPSGAPSHMYELPPVRPNSEFSSAYGLPSGPSEQYPYGGLPSRYSGDSTMKPQQLSSPALTQSQSGRSGYPQLPTARILPQALPTASGVSSGSGSAGTGNGVPVDDVVDRVTNMGFPIDQVRATVRKLTEKGEAVDLNIVLDKLMNDGQGQPPQRGWFGR